MTHLRLEGHDGQSEYENLEMCKLESAGKKRPFEEEDFKYYRILKVV